MIGKTLVLLTALALSADCAFAQTTAERLKLYPWLDTTGESDVYPVGDAIGVYRAVLDLVYTEGAARPSVIVMRDTVDQIAERPCPVRCDQPWPHKSRIDTTTILGFARFSPKRPRMRDFGYSIPLAFVSRDDEQRMRADGTEYMKAHNIPDNDRYQGAAYGLITKYPGAWGLTQLSKVGFNKNHTEALVQIRHWCGNSCDSRESLFLKRIGGRWKVIERIPQHVQAMLPDANLRYRGPAGSSPAESEIVGDMTGGISRMNGRDENGVYRAVLDSLYNFHGESPPTIVFTDRFAISLSDSAPPRTAVDPEVLQRYDFLRTVRSVPQLPFSYKIQIRFVSADSLAALEKLGASVARETGMQASAWFGLARAFPGVWGLVGFSRIAFNLAHTQAMVYSDHQCGPTCSNADTWVLKRRGEKWQIVERIPRRQSNLWDPSYFPLRYLGGGASAAAYNHRRASAVFTNAVTGKPLRFLHVSTNGSSHTAKLYRTDSRGRIDIGTIPFSGIIVMRVACPDQSQPDSLSALKFILSPGADTTLASQLDFRECFHTSTPPITGSEALISADEATFTFPFQAAERSWQLPIIRQDLGVTSYHWIVSWRPPRDRPQDPVDLWLMVGRHSLPQPRTLAEVIAGHHPDAMLECHTCDQSLVSADRTLPSGDLSARIDSGRVVFTLRGREAVKHVFPVVPHIASFSTLVRHRSAAKNKDVAEVEQAQAVIVNCRIDGATGAGRRRCNAPGKAATTVIDSSARRRVKVVALTYDGTSLVRNADVRVRSEDRKDPPLRSSTGATGSFTMMKAPLDSVTIDALCPAPTHGAEKRSGRLAVYLAPGPDTTVQLIVDPRRCSR